MYFSRIRIRPEIFKSTQLAQVLSDSSYNMHRLLWDLFAEQKQRCFLYREEIAREQLGTQAGVRGEPVYYVVSSTRPFVEKPLFKVTTKTYEPKLQKGDLLNFELRANPVVTKKTDRENHGHYLKERSRRPVTDKNKITKKRVRHDVVMDAQFRLLNELALILKISNDGDKSKRIKKIINTFQHSQNTAAAEHLKETIKTNERFREFLNLESHFPQLLRRALKANADTATENWLINKGKQNGFEPVRDEKHDLLKFQAESYRWHALPKKGHKAGFSSVDFEGVLQVTDPILLVEALFNGIGPAKAFGCGLMLVRRI